MPLNAPNRLTLLRSIIPMLAVTLAALLVAGPAAARIVITDILGREVALDRPATRLVLGEGRHMSVLGLLHDDPVSLVVGWRLDKALDPPTMDAYRQRFPQIDAIRPVGSGNRDISTESIIALQPDLLVLSLMDAGDPGLDRARAQVEAAGIPVVYVDFFSHPQENTLPSLHILAALTGTEERADAFAEFYQTRMDRIRDRLAEAEPERPDVFFHVHAAPSGCCSTVGMGVFNDFIATAGGRNIGADVVQGVLGNVSLEYLIAADPDFYVATGGAHMAARGGLVLGPTVDADAAQDSLHALLSAPGMSSLPAVQDGHAAGVWHLFNDNPAHIALIEYLAQLFHPELFADLDPAGTLAEIDERFLPVAVAGTWWVRPDE
ncbi:MAG: ABC transporter substrate-binding protein [Paracoccus sp. (in: a-proteobacteria)]|uniref:ABC transporter substrate-binding protein n=1 Tax=Paracoccus sp. TaxID=267 RepID=UPI0026DF0487|nr:ABC transporter substrate-binding protein [Paracoccus sp. (in: a-proteobacteria)]MDO5622755.1 ABC transporter substrate-binding protein [Paracoccus sp. (in: a-proteobacteria)]